MKPRIRRSRDMDWPHEWWMCYIPGGRDLVGFGHSPNSAYVNWVMRNSTDV